MKRLIKGIAATSLALGMCFAVSACDGKSAASYVDPEESATHSIITKLNLNIDFSGDKAVAKVKNTFTLFPATATVYVYLYYSADFTDDYTAMTELANNYTPDLDMGKTLTASASTVNRGGYYLARMRYKIDSREWNESVTDVYYRDGIILQPIEDDGSLPVFENVDPVLAYQLFPNDYETIFEESNLYTGLSDDGKCKTFENETIKQFIDSIEKEFLIFTNPLDRYYSIGYTYYSVSQKDSEYVLYKSASLNIRELGYSQYPDLENLSPWEYPLGPLYNILLDFSFVNIENINLNGKLNLQFGNCENKGYNKFINLYIGDIFIGTCFYETLTIEEISYAFFYNLFVDGLRVI